MDENKIIIKKSGSFLTWLTLLFIALKLTNNITWSWLWVLSPLWLPGVLILIVLGFLIIIAGYYK